MPMIKTNSGNTSLDISFHLEGDGNEVILLLNGIADEKESWEFQTPAFVDAGYWVLSVDNREVGETGFSHCLSHQ